MIKITRKIAMINCSKLQQFLSYVSCTLLKISETIEKKGNSCKMIKYRIHVQNAGVENKSNKRNNM